MYTRNYVLVNAVNLPVHVQICTIFEEQKISVYNLEYHNLDPLGLVKLIVTPTVAI